MANPGDTVPLTVAFRDAGPNDGPWTYAITWGDGASTNGTVSSAAPFTTSHVYTAPALDSVRVTVTNAFARTGSDSIAVQAAPAGPTVLVGAGDIADSSKNGDSLTANLLDGIPGTVFTLGDNAYPMGASADYTKWYGPTWGRHKARTRPVPGNHEYSTKGAPGYFGYFGAAVGSADGYYSYNLGDWHIIALNGELDVSPTSPQVQWLRADLALYGKRCTLAYWHEPRFVSGVAITSNPKYQTLWDTLYQYGADIVLNGHKRSYERLAPQSPAAVLDTLYGIRAFIVGTGGIGLDGRRPPPLANSEVRNTSPWGGLNVTLDPGRGNVSAPMTTTATIGNAAPVATAAAQTATVAVSFTFSATFSDAGVNDGPWSYTIVWGDSSTVTTGSVTTQTTPITAAHTYAAVGTD